MEETKRPCVCEDNGVCPQPLLCYSWGRGDGKRGHSTLRGLARCGLRWSLPPAWPETGKQLQTPSPRCPVVGGRGHPSGVTDRVQASLPDMASCQVTLPLPLLFSHQFSEAHHKLSWKESQLSHLQTLRLSALMRGHPARTVAWLCRTSAAVGEAGWILM